MADAVTYSDGIGRRELRTVRRRFTALHRERLRNINRELTSNQRVFLELLPLLFHINHPTLPGFAGSDAPIGIPDYTPSQPTLRSARKLSRSFEYKKRARRRFHIQALYLMGSIGSIAHTSGSDFDIWLCYDPELDTAQRQQLRQKARKIEAWGNELNLEVHFFLMDVEAFRNGTVDALSHESSGTTQPHLLLEEFYRTGVHLAGRYPVWWLVPPEEESNYNQYVEMLFHKRFVDPLDCLDFGSLESIPVEEFLGAAHWQLYKGIESPYKTILKLFLTEAYAQEYPDIRWLCQEAKSAIYSGDVDLYRLDPYLLMYQRVEQYLLARGEQERLALARRCLYFKSEQTLSHETRRLRDDWKRDMLQGLARKWGWQRGELVNLDARQSWKIDQVMDERNHLVRELNHSYRLLTDFAQEYASTQAIDPQELSLLGRKLYSALEKRPGKIDSINPGITRSLFEERVSLHYR
ncbi:MAG: class I adenylate cyclase, partial [Sedimenticola sp.]|nr:class I adenylate cyclase [Sedimenticola sp.]